nr:MAG TPA: hypothetical protein [Caudoviricetes sp.]
MALTSQEFMEGYEQGMTEAMAIAKAHPEAFGSMFAASTWRHASERNPNFTGYYLVQTEREGTRNIRIAMYSAEAKRWLAKDVMHWAYMHLYNGEN